MKSLWKSATPGGVPNASKCDESPEDSNSGSDVFTISGSVSQTGCVGSSLKAGHETVPLISRRDFLIAAGAVTCAGLHLIPSAVAEQSPTKVGFVLPEHGTYADDGKSLLSGFNLFLKEHKDTVPTLELFQEDPGKDDTKALEALTALVMNRNVHFVIGPMSLQGSTKAVHAVSGTETILFVTNPLVRLVAGEMCFPGSFRLIPNSYQQSQPLGPWCVMNVGRNVLLTGTDDPLGNELADFFAHGFEKSGGKFVDRIMTTEDPDSFQAVFEKIDSGKPDLVFASFRKESAVEFLKEFKKRSFEKVPAVVGPESLTSYPKVLGELGTTASGVSTLTYLKDPKSLVSRIKKELGAGVTNAARAAEGYDLALTICTVIGKSGEHGKSRTELVQALMELEIDGPRGKIRFDKNHEGIFDAMVQRWETEGGSPSRTIPAELGPSVSPDFGCGRVGFPAKPHGWDAPDSDPSEKK